jgi:fructan beta-fructosidase
MVITEACTFFKRVNYINAYCFYMKTILPCIALTLFLASCANDESKDTKKPDASPVAEAYRPQIHFSPKEKWMNDPNGLVYYNNTYHLFYQYYPDSTVWGPMHWGHATSTDLVHWEHQPIALYPDSLGYIFSGSAVIDVHNTSGFGKEGKPPMVVIFTHHDPKGEAAGRNDYQNQSIAYSTDEGKTWTKYAGNPVLKNPGIKDFRDPKVSWHEESKKWIMSLATMDRITFYSSADLKSWTKESEFGQAVGAHGGVWECPDLFALEYQGKKIWVLLVSINPGGPNGGSATQYFTGQFDGKTFTPYDTDIRWIDYGPDDYAGVTWSNTGKRRIFIGWMSNWQYGTVVPTQKWRSAMTVPRELTMEELGHKYFIRSEPINEITYGNRTGKSIQRGVIEKAEYNVSEAAGGYSGPAKLSLYSYTTGDFSVTLSNTKGEKLVMGYESKTNQYYIDRTASGKTDFEKGFAARHTAPRISKEKGLDCTFIIDDASVELFADLGLTVMTEIFFPNEVYNSVIYRSPDSLKLEGLEYWPLKSIW